jgi:hypothetical protein
MLQSLQSQTTMDCMILPFSQMILQSMKTHLLTASFLVFAAATSLDGTGAALAQGLPAQPSPVYQGAIGGGPGSMIWERGKASGSGLICGQTYSNDNEKAALLARQAKGQCGPLAARQGKPSGPGLICGQSYADDNQKAALLARQARGQC